LSSEAEVRIPLADAIGAIRQQLKQAMDEGREEELRFGLGAVELELQMQVSGERGVDGGVKVWVVSLGGRASHSTAETHTVRLTLHPQDREGKDVDIHGTTGGKPVG
jgi:Trypsin-co-occurring domain 2